MYEKCEKSGELSLVMKANSLRRRAEEKQQEVVVLDREIACLFMFIHVLVSFALFVFVLCMLVAFLLALYILCSFH